MKRTRKSLLLALNWVLLSFGTSILIILTQPTAPVPAQEPATSGNVETTNTSNSQKTREQELQEVLQRSSDKPVIIPETTPSPEATAQPTPTPSPEAIEPKKLDLTEEPAPTPEEIAGTNCRSGKNLSAGERTFY